jgi:hypothetical protein
MAKKKPVVEPGYVLYDVLYEDGTRTSNRKVPRSEVSEFEGLGPVRAFIEAQDRKIAELSGNPRGPIKTLIPSPDK